MLTLAQPAHRRLARAGNVEAHKPPVGHKMSLREACCKSTAFNLVLQWRTLTLTLWPTTPITNSSQSADYTITPPAVAVAHISECCTGF